MPGSHSHVFNGELTAFAVLSVSAVVLTFLLNCMSLHCVTSDKKLHCILNIILCNHAVLDIIFSVAVLFYNLIIFLPGGQHIVLCDVYLTMTFLVHTQTLMLLLIVTYDRVKLIKGVLQYRHFMTAHTATRMIVVSWVLTITITVIRALYMERVLTPSSWELTWSNAETVYECRRGFLAMDWGSMVEILLMLVLGLLYVYVAVLCKKSHSVLSSIQMFESRKSTFDCEDTHVSLPRLSARESTGQPLYTKMHIHEEREDEVDHSDNDIGVGPAASDGEISTTKKRGGSETMTIDSIDNRSEYLKHSRRSVAFDKAELLKVALRPQAAAGTTQVPTTASRQSMRSEVTSTAGRSHLQERSLGERTASTHTHLSGISPWILNIFPFLAQRQTSSSWRTDTKAAQQLGVLLLLTAICILPQIVTREVVVFLKVEDPQMEVVMRWFLWLAHMRALLFPIVYSVYSPRLRSHFVRHLCLCQWHFVQVSPTNFRVDSHTELPSCVDTELRSKF